MSTDGRPASENQSELLDELVIADHMEDCPYLPGRTARTPLRVPRRQLTPGQFDSCMAAGDRRSGIFLYRTECPNCQACEPIRLPVAQFRLTGSHRRVLRRGDAELTIRLGAPEVDTQRLALFNRHRIQRGLTRFDDEPPIGLDDYADFLVQTCCDTLEIAYYHQGQLIGVAIADRGMECLSAVYYYFDPDFARYSPGVYSILKQLQLCEQWQMSHLYLGLFIADCRHMAYKSNYRPHQRLIGGRWQEFA